MKSAGVLFSKRQIVLAVIISNAVQIYRLKDITDLIKVLSTAKPDVVGVDASAANLFDDIYYSFNAIRTGTVTEKELQEAGSKLIKLNIITDKDEIKAMAVAYISASQTRPKDERNELIENPA